jgi:predicted short-subunit dehydrogenase-like oxidoreductase (DUF2520 family)
VKVAVVGAGRAGTAVAVLLHRAGHEIVAVSGREPTRERAARFLPGVPLVDAADAPAGADLAVIGLPDDLIGSIVSSIAAKGGFGRGQWVAHLSGASPLSVLDGARAAGARRLAIHPLQTFPDPGAGIERIPGSVLALGADDEEGFGVAEHIAQDLGGDPFRLPDDRRGLSHAAAVFASNYLVATAAVADRLFASAGVPDPVAAMGPLQEATLANIAALGPGAALTGPAARGDAGTIERNLEALSSTEPWAVAAYVEMARVALDLAVGSGRLDPTDRARVEEVLRRWT